LYNDPSVIFQSLSVRNPTLTKKNHSVIIVTVAYWWSVSKIKEICALCNIQKSNCQFFWTFELKRSILLASHNSYAFSTHFSVPDQSKKLLCISYAFFNTGKIQSRSTHLLIV